MKKDKRAEKDNDLKACSDNRPSEKALVHCPKKGFSWSKVHIELLVKNFLEINNFKHHRQISRESLPFPHSPFSASERV